MIFVAVLTLVVAGLMALTEKTVHEKIIDVAVLLTGSIALVMAILTEAELEKHSRRFSQIHSEILEALNEIREINADNDFLKKKVSQEYKIDKQISKKLDKIAKEERE